MSAPSRHPSLDRALKKHGEGAGALRCARIAEEAGGGGLARSLRGVAVAAFFKAAGLYEEAGEPRRVSWMRYLARREGGG